MAIVAKAGGAAFETTPEGVYIARCIKIIDLGTQKGEWKGQVKYRRQVMITWEILEDSDGDEVRMEDGRPFAITRTYTLSLDDKANLTKDLQSWRGKNFTEEEKQGFDITNLLDKYCMIQVVHNDKGYADVATLMFTKKKPTGVNPTTLFEIETPNMEVFESLSDYVKGKIQDAEEWGGGSAAAIIDESKKPTPEDLAEIPF